MQKLAWLDTYPNEAAGVTREEIASKDFDSPAKLAEKRDLLAPDRPVRCWVAEAQGTIIGFIMARRIDPAEITAMYVLQAYRGQGIAQQLMQAALEWIGPEVPVRVQAAYYNARALAFYRKCGFADTTERVDPYILPLGSPMPQTLLIMPPRTG